MKRMYVIKKGNRYVADANLDNSFTRNINKAYVSWNKSNVKRLSNPDKGEIVVKVSRNKTGELVEVN